MSNLNKKQKIIVGIIASIIVVGICYYVYARDTNLLAEEQNLEIEQNEVSNSEEKTNSTKETFSDTFIMVHISGAVNKEGIVELKANARIADAIEKAGGVKENAYMDEINLAYVLEDGMKIHILTIEEQKEKDEKEQESINNNGNNVDSSNKQEDGYITKSSGVNIENKNSSSTSSEIKQNIKVNINTATQTQLETLPGIGPSTALKIIAYRTEKGKFKNIEDIKEVSGIGESKFNNIKNLIVAK